MMKGRGYSIHANNLKYDFLELVELIEHNIEKANNLKLESVHGMSAEQTK